jgi:hypothetical protein
MWFYIFLAVVAILLLVWVTRTNLFRHWRSHGSDPGQEGTNRGASNNQGISPTGFDDGRGQG